MPQPSVGAREATRRQLSKSRDPRVGRTGRAIIDGVHALIADGSEVSVTNIVQASGVSRSGFYSHFGSIDELAASIMTDAFTKIALLESAARREHPEQRAKMLRRSLEMLVDHYVENRALYAAVASMPLSRDAYLSGVRLMAEFIEGSIGERSPAPSFMRPDLTSRFIASATYGLLDAWLRGEIEATALELLEHIDRLTPEWYRS